MIDDLDCLVIGGGPAGLTAAIYLGRFQRRVLVVDKGWSRAEWIAKSHNLPGFPDGIAGPALLENLRVQTRLYGAILEAGVVDSLLRDKDEAPFMARSAPRPWRHARSCWPQAWSKTSRRCRTSPMR